MSMTEQERADIKAECKAEMRAELREAVRRRVKDREAMESYAAEFCDLDSIFADPPQAEKAKPPAQNAIDDLHKLLGLEPSEDPGERAFMVWCEVERLQSRRDALQKFKDYVHQRLDDAGAPVDPDSPHKADGCRIGGRLDWVLARAPRALAERRHQFEQLIVGAERTWVSGHALIRRDAVLAGLVALDRLHADNSGVPAGQTKS